MVMKGKELCILIHASPGVARASMLLSAARLELHIQPFPIRALLRFEDPLPGVFGLAFDDVRRLTCDVAFTDYCLHAGILV